MKRDTRPFWSDAPGVPFDEMQFAEWLSVEGWIQQMMLGNCASSVLGLAELVNGYEVDAWAARFARPASNKLRLGRG